MSELVIIDNGGGNVASVRYALERLGVAAVLSNDPARVRAAARVILPGVGAAGEAMRRLAAAGLDRLIPTLTQPVLGICLGMQLLYAASAEGDTGCLGVIRGRAARLAAAPGRPVPHMGWNRLRILHADPLLDGIAEGEYVYFVHSFAAPVSQNTLASAEYGADIAAVVRRDNFWGTQFHPERSTKVGARILANFLRLT